MKNHLKKFKKFSFVGLINTIIDFAVFYFLHNHLDIYYLLAHIAAFIIAVINSFILNAIWTFRALDIRGIVKQAALFLVVAIFALAISSITIYVANIYMNIYIAKIIAAMVAMLCNYWGSCLFVFNKKG